MTDFSVLSFGISDTRGEIPAITGSSVPLSLHLIPLGKAIYEGGTWARCCRPLLLLNFPPSHTDAINGLQRPGRTPAHWVPRAPAQLRPPGLPRAASSSLASTGIAQTASATVRDTVASFTCSYAACRLIQDIKLNGETSSEIWIKGLYFLLKIFLLYLYEY